MGDMKEIFEAHKEMKKERKADRLLKNLEIINKSGIDYYFYDSSNTLLFREDDKPKVDFYPSTGRWKVKNKIYRGGATAFLSWYEKQ